MVHTGTTDWIDRSAWSWSSILTYWHGLYCRGTCAKSRETHRLRGCSLGLRVHVEIESSISEYCSSKRGSRTHSRKLHRQERPQKMQYKVHRGQVVMLLVPGVLGSTNCKADTGNATHPNPSLVYY
jgi:hypothetical protein